MVQAKRCLSSSHQRHDLFGDEGGGGGGGRVTGACGGKVGWGQVVVALRGHGQFFVVVVIVSCCCCCGRCDCRGRLADLEQVLGKGSFLRRRGTTSGLSRVEMKRQREAWQKWVVVQRGVRDAGTKAWS